MGFLNSSDTAVTTTINGSTQVTQSQTNLSTASGLNFPVDLGKNGFNYWMSFSFYNYQLPLFGIGFNGVLSDQGTVRLPLPNQMIDNQQVQYNDVKLKEALSKLIPASGNKAVSVIGGALSAVGQAAAGAIINPFMVIMFQSPTFKKHTLTWKLTPSSEQESRDLNQIINTFKYNQLPAKALGGFLLSFPNIVQITVSVNNPTYFTYVFKPAVIEDLQVTWTPSGQPSFFGSTQAPTEVQITMAIQEIEFWTQEDYGAPNTTGTTQINSLNDFFAKGLEGIGTTIETVKSGLGS
jgi:hypothetical protein